MSSALPRVEAADAPTPRDGLAAHRFGVNVAANLAYFVLSTGLMVWYVPFLVHHLGVAAYGMVPLANAVVMYAIVVSESLYTAYFRYLAIDLNRGDAAAARLTFSSAALVTLAACALLLVPFAGFTLLLPYALDVPPGLDRATQFLFAGAACTMLAGILSGLFGTSSAIAHRFDLRNLARGAALAARVGVVAACFALWPASLWHVGAALMVSAVVGLAVDVAVCRHLTPSLSFTPGAAERPRVLRLLGMAGWSSVNMLGFLVLMHADLLIINLALGPEATGRYGAILLIPALIHATAEILMPMLGPLVMARYAQGDREGIRQLVTGSARLLVIGLALPVGLLCGLGGPLLSLWLGPDFAGMGLVLALLVGHLAVNLALRPVAYVLTAYDRIRVQALVTLALGAAYVVLAATLAVRCGWGLSGVAAAGALVWTVRNVGFLAGYCAAILGLRWSDLARPLARGGAGLVGLGLAGHAACALWPPLHLGALAGLGLALAGAYACLAWSLLLTPADRALVRSCLAPSSPRERTPC